MIWTQLALSAERNKETEATFLASIETLSFFIVNYPLSPNDKARYIALALFLSCFSAMVFDMTALKEALLKVIH